MSEQTISDRPSIPMDELDYSGLVRGYVLGNRRFLRRDWLAARLDAKLAEAETRFVLLTAKPGAGKSAFMAQLAHDHPEWARYFIRRDQSAVLSDVADKSLLLRIGYQLASRRPDLFKLDQVSVSVAQRIGVNAGGEAFGAEVERLTASPFYRKVLEIEQNVQTNRGKVVGLRVGELVVEPRLLPAADLLHMALVDPALALQRIDPGQRIVILIDALDEIRYHAVAENILSWVTNCPELPGNIRFVLTSRPDDEMLGLFRRKQARCLSEIAITDDDADVQRDAERFVADLTAEQAVTAALDAGAGNSGEFARRVIDRSRGNLGYLDAVARGLDRALAARDEGMLRSLVGLKELPEDLEGLYTFFLLQIKASMADERIEVVDAETGETYDKKVWPAVCNPILGVLAVALEPMDLDLLMRLAGVRAERAWVLTAVEKLRQFLDVVAGRYRLYHATVAEFLTSEKTRTNAEATVLYHDAAQRHGQIAGVYWKQGADWSTCDPYGLAHLATHLYHAKQIDRLHALISPSWMAARFAGPKTHDGFLGDLDLAWRRAHENAMSQIESGVEPGALAACFRYSLIRTSLNQLSSNYSPALVRRAVELGLWSFARAMSVALHASEKEEMLAEILRSDNLKEEERGRVLAELLPLVLRHADSKLGAALQSLAPRLHGELLERAWTAAEKQIRSKWQEVKAPTLVTLALRFDGPRRKEALQEALAATLRQDERDLDGPLRMLAPHLDDDLLEMALANKLDLDVVLEELVGRLMPPLLKSAQRHATALEKPDNRARALAVLAPAMKDMAGDSVSRQAVAEAARVKGSYGRCNVLKTIGPRLFGRAVEDAIAVADTIEDEGDRADALGGLVPVLDDEQLERVYRMVLGISSDEESDSRARALVALAPRLKGFRRREAIENALAVEDGDEGEGDDRRAWVLAKLVPVLTEEEMVAALATARQLEERGLARVLEAIAGRAEGELAEQVFAEAASLDRGSLAEIIVALAPRAPVPVVEKALAAALAMDNDDDDKLRALVALGPRLTETQIDDVLARASGVDDFEQLLVVVAARLTGPQVAGLVARRRIDEGVLAVIAPRLTAAQVEELLARALVGTGPEPGEDAEEASSAGADREDTEPGDRTSDHGPASEPAHVPRPLGGEAAAEMIERSKEMEDVAERATYLIGLVEALGPAERGGAARPALEATLGVIAPGERLEMLKRLLSLLPPGEREKVAAPAFESMFGLEGGLDLLPYLESEVHDRLVQGLIKPTGSFSEMYSHSRRLAALTPYMTADAFSRAMVVALELLDWGYEEAACAMASRATTEQVPVLLDAAIKSDAGFSGRPRELRAIRTARADLLMALLPRLDDAQLARVLGAVKAQEIENRLKVVLALVPRLEGVSRAAALEAGMKAVERAYGKEQVKAIEMILPWLDGGLARRAVELAEQAYKARDRGLALIALLGRPELKERARRGVLRALAEHMFQEFPQLERGHVLHDSLLAAAMTTEVLAPVTLEAMRASIEEVDERWAWM